MATIDWATIRAQYESGLSQRSLAREHGISQPAISKRAFKEGWVIIPSIAVISDNPPDNIDPSDPVFIADQAIADLAKYLSGEPVVDVKLELKEHKLFADSFSQYIKIKLMLPSTIETASGIASDLLPYLDMSQLDELAQLQARQEDILESAKAKKLEAEQGIMSIKRKAI